MAQEPVCQRPNSAVEVSLCTVSTKSQETHLALTQAKQVLTSQDFHQDLWLHPEVWTFSGTHFVPVHHLCHSGAALAPGPHVPNTWQRRPSMKTWWKGNLKFLEGSLKSPQVF